MSYGHLPWNPSIPYQAVRIKNNPGRKGVTTGITKESAGRLLVRVSFGPNEEQFKQYEQLELFTETESIRDLLAAGHFGKPSDLRQILTFEKIKGNLTNVFYSMESSNTDFYAYQFKPVLKFLDSPVGRLLIADEVGLGKTIESTYIWKELQARQDARRLLIVCPSMLRDKWASDLKNCFNLEAELIDAKRLLEKLQSFVQTGKPQSFIYVVSFEGVRPPREWRDEEKTGDNTRAQLARLLNENSTNEQNTIFDLVIFDEAHYLRNPETANNRLAQILREASQHILLLTATPIQIRSDNLYQLLRLVSPEDFYDRDSFEQMLAANKPIVQALSLVWKASVISSNHFMSAQSSSNQNITEARELVEQAIESPYFSGSSRLRQVHQQLEELEISGELTPTTQVKLAQVLESSSLFGQFMTRSRKRDVILEKVKRSPQVLQVTFSDNEKRVYERVTNRIRQKAKGKQGVTVFSLIMRQRQMASCMVAALKAWQDKGLLDDLLDDDLDGADPFWEDFGSLTEIDMNPNNLGISLDRDPAWEFTKDELKKLEEDDTKYKELIKFLKKQLKETPQEKFVLFAYFRGTLQYLQRRLSADGIGNCLIMGGGNRLGNRMSRLEKWQKISEFKDNPTRSILLSSEVGSEGIDLQFCRVLINYDLPWNPMRVEQRIGRLDRLKQKAKNISIINFSLLDTIEELILERLYNRIKIFEESIGDLDEILGEKTEQLLLDLLSPDLTVEDRIKLEQNTLLAIENQIQLQRNTENEAINMVAFSDYILDMVNRSRTNGRWLHPEELEAFVQNYFGLQYPGTVITQNILQAHVYDISLSVEAKLDLRLYYENNRSSVQTNLYQTANQAITCFFDPKITGAVGNLSWELLDPTHPLIRWIGYKYETKVQTFQPVSANELSLNDVQQLGLGKGIYIYVIHLWQLLGLRKENRLAYKIIHLKDEYELDGELAEALVTKVIQHGKQRPNAINLIDDPALILKLYDRCDDLLQDAFLEATDAFDAENTDWCNLQENNAKRFHDRKIAELESRIERYTVENKTRIIPAERGKIGKIKQNFDVTIAKINQKRKTEPFNPTLATGIIFIDD